MKNSVHFVMETSKGISSICDKAAISDLATKNKGYVTCYFCLSMLNGAKNEIQKKQLSVFIEVKK